jgi:CBS domain-containing protein
MSAEQSAQNQNPAVAVAKTASTRRAREDKVTLLETDDYVCVEPSTPLAQAIEIMKQDEGGCAIVCAKDRSVVGIITERDLLMKIVGNQVDPNAPVSEWMSPVVATLSPQATIGEVVAMMNERGHRNIPLVNDGKLVGSVSVFDVIRYLAESYPKSTMNLPPNPHQVMESEEGG